jgi:hypothetical protein
MSNSNLTTVLTAVLPSATDTVLGGVMVQSGSGLAVDSSGNLSVTNSNPLTNSDIEIVQVTSATAQLLTSYSITQNSKYVWLNAMDFTPPGDVGQWPTGFTLTMPMPLGNGHIVNVRISGNFNSIEINTSDGSIFFQPYARTYVPILNTNGGGFYTFVYSESDTCWYEIQAGV